MRVALIGYGKMGKTIEDLLTLPDQVVARIDLGNSLELGPRLKADVAIEFSAPDAAVGNVIQCFEIGLPVVCGTTGWYDRLDDVRQLCSLHNGALVYSPNFSIGVNLFFALNRQLAIMMEAQPQYDPRIEETHHVHKLDAPSGTAIRLAEGILKEVKRKRTWTTTSSAKDDELIVLSHRHGEVPGTHSVSWSSPSDEINIEHKAHSRQGFAEGAIMAAHWLIGKRGVFTMSDVLNIQTG
jgi:4-hydroxy-tetrahydrodipicolinate reductase